MRGRAKRPARSSYAAGVFGLDNGVHLTYTIQAVIPGLPGPGTVTRRIDVRPGDFESIDLRASGEW